jgi:hypothetical protein
MRYALEKQKEGPMSEMAIVNTFTKLIFGEDDFSAREVAIIEALQSMNNGVSCATRKAVGEYLRNLGVREMIDLVSSLQKSLSDCAKVTAVRRPGASANRSSIWPS